MIIIITIEDNYPKADVTYTDIVNFPIKSFRD